MKLRIVVVFENSIFISNLMSIGHLKTFGTVVSLFSSPVLWFNHEWVIYIMMQFLDLFTVFLINIQHILFWKFISFWVELVWGLPRLAMCSLFRDAAADCGHSYVFPHTGGTCASGSDCPATPIGELPFY